MTVPTTQRRAELFAVLWVERVEQFPRPGEHRRRVAQLDGVDSMGAQQLPGPAWSQGCEPGRHEGMSDHRQPAGVVDGVDSVLDRHVHPHLVLEETADDVNPW